MDNSFIENKYQRLLKEPVFLEVLGLLVEGFVTLFVVEPSFLRVVELPPEFGVPVPVWRACT
ncbi:hypothetical protein AB4Z22_21585, partial [Paenibacillus sp. TAF58]